ncbi:MAG: acetyl-CoA acetyltransferase [Dehalococcoidia bacterium]|nr:acetyl-CoA acetyltransferase [Dehalococcoidia bacterium]
MRESIKDKVAIVGMGCTQFGERWDADVEDLIKEASMEALEDAGVEIKDIQAGWVGTGRGSQQVPMGPCSGIIASSALQTQYIPFTRVENLCCSGQEALRAAALGVASKCYDLVLAIGVEKLKDTGYGGLGEMYPGNWQPIYGALGTPPGRYALAATAYFSKYGLSPQEGKRVLAEISVKSHYYGYRNPKSHLKREITVEEAVNAPMICWPLGLYDCCGVTDGASAAVLVPTEDAKKYRDDYVTIKGFAVSTGPGWLKENEDYDFTYWKETQEAAKVAYAEAEIKDPRKELGLVELHDCFSIAELIATESMFLCEPGKFREEFTEKRAYYHDGEMPVDVSGGLKSFGHPIGASGAREVYEIYKQIQGKAEEPSRQIKDITIGLAHNQGGHPGMFVSGIAIIGVP